MFVPNKIVEGYFYEDNAHSNICVTVLVAVPIFTYGMKFSTGKDRY